MNYEKLYKEALKRAKGTILYYKEHNRGDEAAIEDLEEIFPELKESWEEKIRKEILGYFQQFENEELRGVNISDWIAWLEKQGEQKSAWSEEDETALYDALWCCKQASSIAKDENDMGNIWYAEKWIKSLKERLKGE